MLTPLGPPNTFAPCPRLFKTLSSSVWQSPPLPAKTPIINKMPIYPDKTIIQEDTHTPRFIAALFSIAKTWKQHTHILTHIHSHIHIHTHTHTLEYYSAIHRSEITPFATIQIDLEMIILSKASQKEKDKYQ